MPDTALMPDQSLQASLTREGFVFVHADAMRRALESFGGLDDWQAFAASWDDLDVDTYMADGGRYRRRRHAVYAAGVSGAIVRAPARPHYQGLDYNPLNGGVARWFTPVDAAVGDGPSMRAILAFSRDLFCRLAPGTRALGHRGPSVPDRSAGPGPRAGRRPKGCIATAWTTSSSCS